MKGNVIIYVYLTSGVRTFLPILIFPHRFIIKLEGEGFSLEAGLGLDIMWVRVWKMECKSM